MILCFGVLIWDAQDGQVESPASSKWFAQGHNPNYAHFHCCKRRNCNSLTQKSVLLLLVKYSGTTAIKAINIYTHKGILKWEFLLLQKSFMCVNIYYFFFFFWAALCFGCLFLPLLQKNQKNCQTNFCFQGVPLRGTVLLKGHMQMTENVIFI